MSVEGVYWEEEPDEELEDFISGVLAGNVDGDGFDLEAVNQELEEMDAVGLARSGEERFLIRPRVSRVNDTEIYEDIYPALDLDNVMVKVPMENPDYVILNMGVESKYTEMGIAHRKMKGYVDFQEFTASMPEADSGSSGSKSRLV